MLRNGDAITSMMSVPTIANTHLCSATRTAHRSQNVGPVGAASRFGWCSRLGTRNLSMLCPTIPMMAGRNVIAASIITATTIADM